MKMDPALEARAKRDLNTALASVENALMASDTDAMKDAIRIARNRLVEAYDALTQAEQEARARYWKISA